MKLFLQPVYALVDEIEEVVLVSAVSPSMDNLRSTLTLTHEKKASVWYLILYLQRRGPQKNFCPSIFSQVCPVFHFLQIANLYRQTKFLQNAYPITYVQFSLVCLDLHFG